jgi:hypothetical protein
MSSLLETFKAYQESRLPDQHGYIMSVFYHNSSNYTRYELISFGNVKDIYKTDDGLVFSAEGRKMYVLVQPAGFPNSHIEPAYRTDAERIPYRFKELIDYTTNRQDHVFIGAEPIITYTNFTILKPVGQDVSYVFFPSDHVKDDIMEFFRLSLWKQARVPQSDARKLLEPLSGVYDKLRLSDGAF